MIPETLARLALVTSLCFGLGACPDLPSSAGGDTVGGDDADVFVPLAIDRVLESVGEAAGGERVAIFGQGITPGAEVRFGPHLATNVLVLDDGRLNVDVPPAEPGLVNVTVVLPDGQNATLVDAYLYRGPLALTSIEPDIGPYAGNIPVTVRGLGFTEATRVVVGERLLFDVTVVDDSTLVGILPARLADQPGRVDVVATDGFEQRELPGGFRYIAPPRVDWIHPASGPRRGGTEVTLYGRGLEPETVVTVGGVVAELLVPGRGDALVLRTPPGAVGPADVALTNDLTAHVEADAFTYLDHNALPTELTLHHAWPTRGPASGGTQVALTVTGLESVSDVSVRFDDADATVLERRPAEDLLVVGSPPGDLGLATITVSGVVTGGGGAVGSAAIATRADLFTYDRALVAERVEPAHGPAAGGEVVRVLGSGYSATAAVVFGGQPATVTEVGAGFVEVVTPPSAVGRVDVVVVDGERRAELPAAYEYRRAGRGQLLAVTPGQGAQSGGRVVRFHGEGFRQEALAFAFNGVRATDLQVVDDGLVIGRAPRGDVGHATVRDPFVGRLAKAYRYFDPSQRFGGTAGGPIPEALNVSVIDTSTGGGVDGAYVILWDDLGTRYQGVADDRGQITFSDVGFGPLQMVTAGADNYTTASVVDFDARDVSLQLIPLVSSPPGGGGGGGGPQPLDPGTLTGKVTGLDKYVLPPTGSCDNRILVDGVQGTLCQPCADDTMCEGDGARCVELGPQGARCTVGCATSADCPGGYSCSAVSGGGVQCLPSPGERTARCSVTRADVFSSPNGPSGLSPTNDEGLYAITSRPGEYAVVCLGGYLDELDTFIPTMMGVRRHVFAFPGDVVAQQDVRLDIPLTKTLRVRLDDAPVGRPETALHTVDVFIDLGADGVFAMPARGRGVDQNVFELEGFPARFAESLYNATYTVYAAAIPDVPEEMRTGAGSFTLHEDIVQIDEDTAFERAPDGAPTPRTGVTFDLFDLHRAPGGEITYGAAERGKVVLFDGVSWFVSQAPTDADLRGVWAAADGEAWAVGDRGAVARWDGLTWTAAPMPEALASVDWRRVHGAGDVVWLLSDDGVFAHDGVTATQVILDVPAASIRDLWADDQGAVWFVGDGGLIGRWLAGSTALFTEPGDDLLAISGSGPDAIWAVGARGRIARWDGDVWFDLVPTTRRALTAVDAAASDRAWAVGDAGEVLRWDGVAWRRAPTAEHVDLRGVAVSDGGRVALGGVHTLIIGPFLRVPRPDNPDGDGVLDGLELRWDLDEGPDASLTWVELQHSSGFPFWTIVSEGARRDVPLPDMKAAWGLDALWPGLGFIRVVRAFIPNFSINSYDNTILTPYAWRSWVVTGWPLDIPEE